MSKSRSNQGRNESYSTQLFALMPPPKRAPLTQDEIMQLREQMKDPNFCRDRWARWTAEFKARARSNQ